MGITNYWYREKLIDSSIYKSILADFIKARQELDRHGIFLASPDGRGLPVMNDYGVTFNGSASSQGCCEAFTFTQELIFPFYEPRKKDGKYFQFVKTEGLPYDLAVEVFLIIAKHYLSDRILVSSDMSDSGWSEARECCQSSLGYGSAFLLENDE
jgi:hypothetical protein